MALWTMTDELAGMPKNSNTSLNSTQTQAQIFNNSSTAVGGKTVGIFGVSAGEMIAEKASGTVTPTHGGWVVRTVGSGGRAGRVQYEVLVAGNISGDSEDTVFEDYLISITTQPSSDSSASGSAVSFAVVAATTPTGGTLSYQWQLDSGSGFGNISNGGVYSGATTATLAISDNTGLDGNIYRCVVSVTGGDDVNSSSATLTEAP